MFLSMDGVGNSLLGCQFWVRSGGFLPLIAWALIAGASIDALAEEDEALQAGVEQTLEELGAEPVVVEYENYRDPLQPINRAIFAFNDGFNRFAFVPAGNAYIAVVPAPARKGIGNLFYTIGEPIYFVNNLLQGRPKRAGKNLARLATNLTLGLGGLMDPAGKEFGLQKSDTRFSDTLSQWEFGYGVYLVIPLLGQSDLRDAVGMIADGFADPVRIWVENPEGLAIQVFDTLQNSAPQGDTYLKLHDEAEDPYLFFRNLHLQGTQRDAEYPAYE